MSEPSVPPGYRSLNAKEVWINEKEVIILGIPGDNHNCDYMGCGQCHVIIRGKIETQDVHNVCTRCGEWPIPNEDEMCEQCNRDLYADNGESEEVGRLLYERYKP